jgi:hypothetical protein
MQRLIKPDPYDGFKNDQERRRALNTRVRCRSLAMVAVALAGAPIDWMGRFRWLTSLFH